MGEAARRRKLGIPNSHKAHHWKRVERMLRSEASVEFCFHERNDGVYRRGEAQLEHEERQESIKQRGPSKVLAKMERCLVCGRTRGIAEPCERCLAVYRGGSL